jgi:hypothetical protein
MLDVPWEEMLDALIFHVGQVNMLLYILLQTHGYLLHTFLC